MHKLSFIPKNIIVATALVTLLANAIKTCPVVCTCKWKGGKRKVECVDKNLTALLTNIDVETQVLDYAKNPLQRLHERQFERANLVNLQKLYLAECRIGAVHATAFRGLANLVELDVSGNALAELPSAAFVHLPQLMKLTAAANPIAALRADTFRPLAHLSALDLSDCQLATVERAAFDGLRRLDWLKLDGNRLRTLHAPHSLLPRVTSGLSLHRNPWRCDCHLRPLRRWLSEAAQPLLAQPTCAEPAPYKGVQLASVRVDELACAPYVVPSSLFVEVDEGKNISFVCQVSAVPEARITWHFEGRPLRADANSSSSLVYPLREYGADEEAGAEQVSELFVFDVRARNNGTYRCVAQNAAGTAGSDYTLNVIVAEPPTPAQPPAAGLAHHLRALVSAASTLIVVALLVLAVVGCLACASHRRTGDARGAKTLGKRQLLERKMAKRTNAAAVAAAADAATLDVGRAAVACRTDANPDLIVNAECGVYASREPKQSCERLLLLPPPGSGSDLKQTYLTLTGNTLVNAAIYESKTLRRRERERGVAATAQMTLVPTAASARSPTSGECDGGASGGTIKLYLAPAAHPAPKFCNLRVNPFDGGGDDAGYIVDGQPCWTLQLTEDECAESAGGDCATLRRHVLIDCCAQQPVCPAAVAAAPAPSLPRAAINASADEFVNRRHNLEGYPYPSKLKLKSSLKSKATGTTVLAGDDAVDTPILSPPDPFKTGTQLSAVRVDASSVSL